TQIQPTTETITSTKTMTSTIITTRPPSQYRDCKDWKDLYNASTGVYDVYPDGRTRITVYCDQVTDGGGWTVITSRKGSFNGGRLWAEYIKGFGDINGNFWLELEVKETTETNNSASYLDIMLSYDTDGHMNTSLYDKRDDFNFSIKNFPFLSSNIPSSPSYGVFISQMIRYARASTKYTNFVLRARRLSDKLLSQGYVCDRLTSSLRKFYGRYGELVIHYDVPLSRMMGDILP
ncbi:hypothetical protein FSP39_010438, partial [Pinctada imbricata]